MSIHAPQIIMITVSLIRLVVHIRKDETWLDVGAEVIFLASAHAVLYWGGFYG